MDAPHVQPLVGLRETFACLRPLLCRNLGSPVRRCATTVLQRAPLARTAALEFGSRQAGNSRSRLLRIDGGRIRASHGFGSLARQALGSHRKDTAPGLVIADEKTWPYQECLSVGTQSARKRLAGYYRGEPALGHAAHRALDRSRCARPFPVV